MRLFQHPAFEDITMTTNTAETEADAIAKGWVPVLNDEQLAHFDALETEIQAKADGAELERQFGRRSND